MLCINFSLHLLILTLINAECRTVYEDSIPFLKNVHCSKCLSWQGSLSRGCVPLVSPLALCPSQIAEGEAEL